MRRQTLCGSKLGDTKVAAPLSKTAPRASNALAFFSAARKRRTSAAFGVRPRCGFPVRTIESRKLAALAGAQEVQTHLHIDDPIVKGASSTKRRINVETTTRPPNRGTSTLTSKSPTTWPKARGQWLWRRFFRSGRKGGQTGGRDSDRRQYLRCAPLQNTDAAGRTGGLTAYDEKASH